MVPRPPAIRATGRAVLSAPPRRWCISAAPIQPCHRLFSSAFQPPPSLRKQRGLRTVSHWPEVNSGFVGNIFSACASNPFGGIIATHQRRIRLRWPWRTSLRTCCARPLLPDSKPALLDGVKRRPRPLLLVDQAFGLYSTPSPCPGTAQLRQGLVRGAGTTASGAGADREQLRQSTPAPQQQ